MEEEPTANGPTRPQSARRFRLSDSSPQYRLRDKNLCIIVFFVIGVITVACACTAIVSAVVEHFWTSIDDSEEGPTVPRKSAQVVMQKLSDDDLGKTVFCFVNQSEPSGSPHPLNLENVSTSFCDAIVYVSVGVDVPQNRIRPRKGDAEAAGPRRLAALKTPSVTTWACVGGEAGDSSDFRDLIRSKKSRLAFIHNAVAWLRHTGLDGLVLYWKYPDLEVRTNWSTLINTMRVLFDKEGFQVTVMLPWSQTTRRHGYFEHSIYERLDMVLVDSHHTVEPSRFPVTTCQSPVRSVFRARHHGQTGLSTILDDLSMVTEHLLLKTVLSVSLAGVSFTIKRPWMHHRVGMDAIGPGRSFGYTNQSGRTGYYDVAQLLLSNASWARFLHGHSRCAVAHWKDQWIGFEDRVSLRAKRPLVRKTLGLAVWDLAMDDFAGDMGPAWPLLRQVHELVHARSGYSLVTASIPL
ncbi:hypothetical protein HPB47_023181 [Ixodes persulcatus]|uniref:Uncharacterized protein n=1 Tax=Ixodes persulcatus TaxID=34615 RepID=A0AC60Q7R8_IXOPE|nr:hypothetical protein HPB47_023181 [Ixodes persulcatus]